MENKILGIHHITAIAGNAKRNHDFYTQVLGLRLVKKTVNFDDPGTYHFYFGNEVGTPGTILTFFPWEGVKKGTNGAGMASDIGYAVPTNSMSFWKDRLHQFNVKIIDEGKRFGEEYISFQDPDGLNLTIISPAIPDPRKPWQTDDVAATVAIRGFHTVTLTLRKTEPTANILTDILGYRFQQQEGNSLRFATGAIDSAAIVDLVESPYGDTGINAGGTIHHIAFRVPDENTLMAYREKVMSYGLNITPKIDRNYFFSLYFREPGGVLFEIATDNPGFSIDEPVQDLGKKLKLPAQYEGNRKKIEEILPVI